MSQCVAFDTNGYLVQSPNCEYVLLTQTEYTALSTENITSLMDTYFKLDPILTGQIVGAFLVTFVVGHGLGRLVRIMGKHV